MILVVLSLTIAVIPLSAQSNLAQDKYASPVNFQISLSGNVGELRTNAFHAGIDIRALKGVGSPIYTVADGYVWRIGVSPRGYGKVIYVKHGDGAISVYAHLDSFVPKIAQWVRLQQYAKKSFKVDLYPGEGRFPVKRGEQIGMLGNSGSSGGAHLHFEIRDPKTSQPTNIIQQGLYRVPDLQKPDVKSIKLFEIDTVDGVKVHRFKQAITPDGTDTLKLRGNGYLAYEILDYKDGRRNTMGIYSLEQKVNRETNFKFQIDYVDFTKGRYMNTLVHYEEHRSSKWNVIRAYRSAHNKLDIYKKVLNRGVISATKSPQNVTTYITDDAGNVTTLNFTIIKDTTSAIPIVLSENTNTIRWNKEFKYYENGFAVTINPESLYDDHFIDIIREGNRFSIGSENIPLHKSFWMTLPASNVVNIDKSGIVRISKDNKETWIGGKYSNGNITASSSTFGLFCVSEDITPPVIRPVDLLQKGSNISFKITDDLSGIKTYELTINGRWELVDFDEKNDFLVHKVTRNTTPVDNNVKLVVTDGCGNSTTFTRTIKW